MVVLGSELTGKGLEGKVSVIKNRFSLNTNCNTSNSSRYPFKKMCVTLYENWWWINSWINMKIILQWKCLYSLNGFSLNEYTDTNTCRHKLCIFNKIHA